MISTGRIKKAINYLVKTKTGTLALLQTNGYHHISVLELCKGVCVCVCVCAHMQECLLSSCNYFIP